MRAYTHTHTPPHLPALGRLSNLWELEAVKDLETRALNDILAEAVKVLTFTNANCSLSFLQLHLQAPT